MKLIFAITETNRDYVLERVTEGIRNARVGDVVEVKPPTRNLEQNALLWPLLDAVSKQVEWYGSKLTDWEWKDVFTAALKKSKVVPGIDGGFVVCGQNTSKMPKGDFSELVELILAFGAQRNVKFPAAEVRNEGKI